MKPQQHGQGLWKGERGLEDYKDEIPMEIYMTTGPDYGVDPAYSLQTAFPGHAVLDSGATETVGSLEAIQALMALRQAKFGPEHFEVLSTNEWPDTVSCQLPSTTAEAQRCGLPAGSLHAGPCGTCSPTTFSEVRCNVWARWWTSRRQSFTFE